MKKAIYQIGQVFNRLTLLEVLPWNEKDGTRLRCKCVCGNEIITRARSIKSGLTQSCGCLMAEGKGRPIIHGHSSQGCSKEYNVWREIKDRCTNPNNKNYNDYGGRGITIYNLWLNDFSAFYAYVGPAPSSRHSIDRIENTKGYIPGNLRWATMEIQTRNKRNNRWFEIDGKRLILNDWAKLLGVTRENFRDMIKRNSFEYAYKFYSEKKGLRT